MKRLPHRFPHYGTVGLVILVITETAVFCSHSAAFQNFRWEWITTWTTPVCWWGYILVVDAWLYLRVGQSILANRRDLFVVQCLLSIAFWCLFEAYNRLMPGWQYVNLTEHLPTRFLGYAVSFATIMPGMFLTCGLLQSFALFSNARLRAVRWTPASLNVSKILGALFCIAPPFFPANVRGHLWALVWIGWVLLLEPFNYQRCMPSLYRDWERGDLSRTLQLAIAGAACGVLWEFWNMWAYTKWLYIFPLGQSLKFFEMPLMGFLGFLPFALEYFVMFHFIASFFSREDKLGL